MEIKLIRTWTKSKEKLPAITTYEVRWYSVSNDYSREVPKYTSYQERVEVFTDKTSAKRLVERLQEAEKLLRNHSIAKINIRENRFRGV